MYRSLKYLLFSVLFVLGCNVSDPGGGLEVQCETAQDCGEGERCTNGTCLGPVVDGGGDAGSNNATEPDMNVELDMSTPGDMGGDDMGETLQCPDGLIDFNLDPADGCETPTFPGWELESCQDCAGIPNAVSGCGAGAECQIMECAEGFYDRDGDIENGCEANCAAGECWDIVDIVRTDYAYLPGPGYWFAAGDGALIGRRLDAEWAFHSLDGPADFDSYPLTELFVVDDVIYAQQAGKLVRSVDHGRTFGRVVGAPEGTVIDHDASPSGPHLFLMSEAGCAQRSCSSDGDCADPSRPSETVCSDSGVCSSGQCNSDYDCPRGSSCSVDGFCAIEDRGCTHCGLVGQACQGTQRVYQTDDLQTFTQLGPDLPDSAQFRHVHGTELGNVIINGPSGIFRWTTMLPQWTPLDDRNCDYSQMYFLASGDGVALGDRCANQYEAAEGKFSNGEQTGGSLNDSLLHDDIIYAVGSDFISVTNNFGRRFVRTPIVGDAVHIYVDPADSSIKVLGSRGEMWRSVDNGASWVQTAEAVGPYPRRVDSGSPLALMGIGQVGDIITPSSNGPTAPWVTLATANPLNIKQDNGGAFAQNSSGYVTGRDWQSLVGVAISAQIVPASAFNVCPNSSPCRVARISTIFDGAYDGTTFYLSAMASIEFRLNALVGWTPAGTVSVVMSSTNGVEWDFVQYQNTQAPFHLATADFGFVTDRGFSPDGDSWFTTGTPDCGLGPFFRAAPGTIMSFDGETVCQTSNGTDWTLVASDFWSGTSIAKVDSIHSYNGAFYTAVYLPAGTAINASDDGQAWSPLGPIWPPETDLDFGDTATVSANRSFFAVGK